MKQALTDPENQPNQFGVTLPRWERVKWYIKQLLPLMYVSEYGTDGRKEVCVWRMWFGRCYNVRTWRVESRI